MAPVGALASDMREVAERGRANDVHNSDRGVRLHADNDLNLRRGTERIEWFRPREHLYAQ